MLLQSCVPRRLALTPRSAYEYEYPTIIALARPACTPHRHATTPNRAPAVQEMATDRAHVERLEKRLREGIMARCDHVQLNGPLSYAQRFPGNVNLSFAYVEGESLLMGLREIAVSSGSACTSSSLEPSYVLRCAPPPKNPPPLHQPSAVCSCCWTVHARVLG